VAYATPTDLSLYGVDAASGGDIDVIKAQLDAASSVADSYLRLHYKLPISTPYPAALVEAVARIASFNVLSVRGYSPEGDAGLLESRHRAAMKGLQDVGAGRAAPLLVTADSGGTVNAGGPFVVQPRRDPTTDATVVGKPFTRGW
jgi:phage gp36-like protein